MFTKEDSLVEVPYVEPSFLESRNVKSMIPRSHAILMNKMKDVMFYMQYDMCKCKMLFVVCNMISMMMHVILIE